MQSHIVSFSCIGFVLSFAWFFHSVLFLSSTKKILNCTRCTMSRFWMECLNRNGGRKGLRRQDLSRITLSTLYDIWPCLSLFRGETISMLWIPYNFATFYTEYLHSPTYTYTYTYTSTSTHFPREYLNDYYEKVIRSFEGTHTYMKSHSWWNCFAHIKRIRREKKARNASNHISNLRKKGHNFTTGWRKMMSFYFITIL